MRFEIVRRYDDKGRRSLVPTGEPDVVFDCDEVLIAVGQENAFPWIERDAASSSTSGACRCWTKKTFQSTRAEGVLRRRCGLRPQEHHHRGGARPRGGGVDRPLPARRGRAQRPPPHVNLVSQKMGIHEWSYDNAPQRHALQGALGQGREGAGQHQGRGGTGLRRRHRLQGGAALPELRRADGVHRQACIECDACVDICPMDCITFTANGEEADLRTRLKAPALNPTRRCTSAASSRPARDGQGRGRLPALRPVRRALPHRRLGHAEVPAATPPRPARLPRPRNPSPRSQGGAA
jgi:formate dehydrogenase beta subunit